MSSISQLHLEQMKLVYPALFKQLSESFSDPHLHLKELFGPMGKYFSAKIFSSDRSEVFNARMKWIGDQHSVSLIIRINSSKLLKTYTIAPPSDLFSEASIMNSFTLNPDRVTQNFNICAHQKMDRNIFKMCMFKSIKRNHEIHFDTRKCHYPFKEFIKLIFPNHKEMLPKSVPVADLHDEMLSNYAFSPIDDQSLNCTMLLCTMESVSTFLHREVSCIRGFLKQLFSPSGKTFLSDDGILYNLRMKLIENEINEAGIIIRFYTEDTLEAYIIYSSTSCENGISKKIFVDNDKVVHQFNIDHTTNPELAKRLGALSIDKGSEEFVHFHPNQVKYQRDIIERFLVDKDMLPSPYHLDDKEHQDDKLELLNELEILESRP